MKLNDPGGGGELLALYGREALILRRFSSRQMALLKRPYLWQTSEVDFRSPRSLLVESRLL
jgi:hypothetical protein